MARCCTSDLRPPGYSFWPPERTTAREKLMFDFMSDRVQNFVDISAFRESENRNDNFFISVSPDQILDAERRLGFSLPSQLRCLYEEFGYGFITVGRDSLCRTTSTNRICTPKDIGDLREGICEWMMPYTKIQPDVLPFFDRDVDLFLCMRPFSENPNAVYWMWGEKICDSLVEFFQRLVENPDWFNPSS